MLAYFFSQRDIHSTTVKQSIKPRAELITQTRDALRPAVQPPLGSYMYCISSLIIKVIFHFCLNVVSYRNKIVEIPKHYKHLKLTEIGNSKFCLMVRYV